jgi:hypothetical protein
MASWHQENEFSENEFLFYSIYNQIIYRIFVILLVIEATKI